MIRKLEAEIWQTRSNFLHDIRAFFNGNGYLEVDTPVLNPVGTMDPFIDSLQIRRTVARKSPQVAKRKGGGYLITSPEYNMKILLSQLKKSIFEITHCFREGEEGDLHSEEFLMLEWYRADADEFVLMDECVELLSFLSGRPYSLAHPEAFRRTELSELFQRYANCSLERKDLEETVVRLKLLGLGERAAELRYDELFHTLFLNRIEKHLGSDGPEFVYGYPPELAALSRVEEGRARRFEIYWGGVELANGYCELSDEAEHRRRFEEHNRLRKRMDKPEMEADGQFLRSLADMPFASGIAMGLDRLLMLLCGHTSLTTVSPYS